MVEKIVSLLLSSKTILISVLLLGLFFRMYQLGSIPAGLLNDEADIGYDAYSILLTGHDQWGQFLPITSFKGFGDYRPVVYTYLVLPAIQLFGLTALSVRLPSAIMGTLSILLIYLVGRKIFSEKVGLIAALLLSISPWSIGMSRVGIESNTAITFILFAIWLFLLQKKYPILLLGSIFFFMLSIYTYTAYILIAPLLFLVLCIFFYKEVVNNKKFIGIGIILGVILFIPYFLHSNAAGIRSSQVGFMKSQDTIGLSTVLNEQRGACVSSVLPGICKVLDNKQMLIVTTFSKNYLHHFSLDFLYLSGTTTQLSILPERGLLYMWEFIFLFAGIIFFIKEKMKTGGLLILFLLISIVPDALTGNGHYSRSLSMHPFIILIEACGILFVFSRLKKRNSISKLFAIVLACCIIYSIGGFWATYITYFKNHYDMYSQFGYEHLMKNIFQEKKNYDDIYLTSHMHDAKQYIYYLFYTQYDPSTYQSKKHVVYKDGLGGWVEVTQVDNLHFISSLQSVRAYGAKSLVISDPSDFTKDMPQVFHIKDLEGNGIFEAVKAEDYRVYTKEQITQ